MSRNTAGIRVVATDPTDAEMAAEAERFFCEQAEALAADERKRLLLLIEHGTDEIPEA